MSLEFHVNTFCSNTDSGVLLSAMRRYNICSITLISSLLFYIINIAFLDLLLLTISSRKYLFKQFSQSILLSINFSLQVFNIFFAHQTKDSILFHFSLSLSNISVCFFPSFIHLLFSLKLFFFFIFILNLIFKKLKKTNNNNNNNNKMM